PDGEDRRDHGLRQHRLPQHPPAVRAGEPEGEPGAGGTARADRREEERDAGPDRPRLAAGPEAVDRSDSGHHEVAPAGGKHRGGRAQTDAGRSPRHRARGRPDRGARGPVLRGRPADDQPVVERLAMPTGSSDWPGANQTREPRKPAGYYG